MARILYAASGDGLGHAVRAHSVGAGLIARGHDVRFLSCHQTIQYLRTHFPDRLHEVFGLFTIYREGQARPMQTVLHNLGRAWREMLPAHDGVSRLMRRFGPDLVITDFEPFSAFAATRLGIPFISLDNQHLLTHCELERPPGFSRDAMNAYMTVRLYYRGARRYLIPTFIPATIRHHPTSLIDSILRPEVYDRTARDDGFLLVYRSWVADESEMLEAMRGYRGLPIRAYGFDRTARDAHIAFKPTSTDCFLDDLASCSGVIASAGHSLISECLYFRKPMLMVPLRRHFEQALNAFHVEKLGAGQVEMNLNARAIGRFVDRIGEHRAAIGKLHRPNRENVLDAVEREIVRAA